MKKVIGLSLVLLFLVSVWAEPSCDFVPYYTEDGTLYWVYECHPDYYTILETEPDWCLYQGGDVVFLKLEQSTGHALAYYAVYGSDLTTPPPTGFYFYRFYIYNNGHGGCSYSIF